MKLRPFAAFLIGAIQITACSSSQSSGAGSDTPAPEITLVAGTSDGRCQPELNAIVNKEVTRLYKIHGEVDYVDMDTGEKTDIPLQVLFRGYDGEGLSEDKSMVGINTVTSCERLSIQAEVQYCLYDDLGRADERQCPETIVFDGEGFGEVRLNRSDSDNPAYQRASD